MQHLCRQGRSAVQVTHDLDIFIVDCLDRVCAGDVTRDGVVNPVDLKTRLTGRLHLRLANIGHMSDLKSSKLSKCACLYYINTFSHTFSAFCVFVPNILTFYSDYYDSLVCINFASYCFVVVRNIVRCYTTKDCCDSE